MLKLEEERRWLYFIKKDIPSTREARHKHIFIYDEEDISYPDYFFGGSVHRSDWQPAQSLGMQKKETEGR